MAMALLPTKRQRLARLLEAGYLPRELPPVFVSGSFAKSVHRLESLWPSATLAQWKSVPEVYSIPKTGHSRRDLAIVNPINQFKVSKVVSDNWVEIRKHIRSSGLTEFTPVIDMTGDRAVLPSNFSEINRRRARLRARFTKVLRTDITRFYPSIYTHSIAWALHGKSAVKANIHKKALLQAMLGDQLDRAVRQGQDDQTVGIPIGPETSRILAEIIAVGIDNLLYPNKKTARESGLRYVDDYTVGLPEGSSDDAAVASIVKAFSHFGLEFQPEKTRVDVSGFDERPAWARELREFSFDRSQPENSVRDYFDEVIRLFEREKREEILTYGVKRSRGFQLYF
jgi:hypothetical protein